MQWTPHTPEHWRQLATVAEAMLDLHVLQTNGLLEHPIPAIDADHLRGILTAARANGVVTRAADVNAMTADLLRQFRRHGVH